MQVEKGNLLLDRFGDGYDRLQFGNRRDGVVGRGQLGEQVKGFLVTAAL